MLVVKLLILAYLFSVIVTYLLVRAAIHDRDERTIFLFLGAALPFLVIVTMIRSIFRPAKVIEYNSEIAAVEDAIETERLRLFGGATLEPSLSERWQRSCQLSMQKYALRTVKYSRRLREFKTAWGTAGRARAS